MRAPPRRRRAVRALLRRAARVLCAVVGAPDYERYVVHALTAHPGEEPLSRERFEQERLAARYSRPGSRCC